MGSRCSWLEVVRWVASLGGAQLAIDTTLVSPVRADGGTPRRGVHEGLLQTRADESQGEHEGGLADILEAKFLFFSRMISGKDHHQNLCDRVDGGDGLRTSCIQEQCDASFES